MVQKIYELLPDFVKTGSADAVLAFKKPGLRKIYSEFISPGDLVFDVGANVGDYSKLFAEMGAKVVSFEPQPSCAEKLRNRFEKTRKVTIEEKGLGSKKCTLPFFISSKSNTTSTFSREWKSSCRFKERSWDKEIKVSVTTLDNMIKKYGKPSFIKIDVEGFELDVLSGLSKYLPAMSLEFGMEYFDSTEKCIKKLMTLGNPQFNYVSFVGTGYALEKFVTGGQLIGIMKQKRKNFGGDIYVRFV
ncbi:MAG: FkbM family methyltransferase [bacterium]